LPTSSSFCIIFFIRAYAFRIYTNDTEAVEEHRQEKKVRNNQRSVFHRQDLEQDGLTTGNLVCLFLFFIVSGNYWCFLATCTMNDERPRELEEEYKPRRAVCM